MNIFITNISYHASTDVLKLLRKIKNQEFVIHVSSEYPKGYCPGSLMGDAFHNQPSTKNPKQYLDFIINACSTNNIDILFAVGDQEIQILSKNKNDLPPLCILPDYEIVNLFCDKKLSNDAIEELGICIPKYIKNLDKLIDIPSGKIVSRIRDSCACEGLKIIELDKECNFNNYYLHDSILQEYIVGDEFTVDVLCDDEGRPIIIIPRKRISVSGGTAYRCEITKNIILNKLTKKIYAKYKIPGFSNVQYIIEKNTNKIYFIELNPRMGGSTILSSLACDNLIEIFLKKFYFHEKIKSHQAYQNNVKWGAIVSRYYEETIYLP